MPTFGATMILGPFHRWNVEHSRGDALFDNGLDVVLPDFHTVVTIATGSPTLYSIGPFAIATELRLQLTDRFGSGGAPHSSTSPSNARFRDGYTPGVSWYIDWEDGGDSDFNDAQTYIYADETSAVRGVHAAPFTFQYSNDPVHVVDVGSIAA